MSSNRVDPAGEELERRGFLRTMALGGAAISGGGLVGCVGSAVRPAPVSDDVARLEAARVDSALERLDTRLAARRGEPVVQGFGLDDPFTPRALRAMTYAGLVLDLPDPIRHSQPIIELNAKLEGELDQTMMDSLWVVAYSGQDARERLDRAVRNHPNFIMDYVETLDLGGAEQGLATGSRLRLRRVATEIGSRLRVESADALLTDLTSKMTRVMGASGSDVAYKRLAVTRATQAIFAEAADPFETASELAAPGEVPQTRSDERLLRYSVDTLDRRFRRRRTTALTLVGIGAISLGVGLGVALGGALGGLFGVTVGIVSLVMSLIMGGLTIRARRQLRRRRELQSPTPT